MSADALKRLREPFAPTDINKLPKPYRKDAAKANCKECGGYHGLPAAHLDYVGHAALTARLLDVDPVWYWEPVSFGDDGLPVFDRNGGLWIRLTVAGMTRLGYGDAQGKTGPNAVKEAIGDALRNAAMRFGAALDLWHKGDLSDAEAARNGADENPAGPPPVDDVTVSEWVETLGQASTLAQLQAAWEEAGKAGVTRDRKVVAAKDKRKGELS